jgi:eukaryotic-like serine/threonine-protein kinase
MVPKPGDLIGRKYRCDKVMSRGGMAAILAAREVDGDRRVVIKLLLEQAMQDKSARARFDWEARAALRITGEHVVRSIDFGTLDDGRPFLVMEYLDGCDLQDLLRRKGPLPVKDVAQYGIQVCEALGDAHRKGIIHRDLKPANLHLSLRPDGSPLVKVLDFGISKATGGSALTATTDLTRPDAVIGTSFYMSPEQFQSSKEIDSRTDVWSLGVILYELLTGKVPFGGETLPLIGAAILLGSPAPLREVRPDVPAGFEAVVLKCLEKEPEQRISDVAALAEALTPFAS